MIIEEQKVSEQWLAEALTETYAYSPPKRGEFRKGVVLKLEDYGAIIDLGLKRDGFVPRSDLERLEDETLSNLETDQEVTTRIMKTEDQNGDLIVSLYQARLEQDWNKAEELLDSEETYGTEVIGYNKGGLLVKFGHLQGFIPASHLWHQTRRRLSASELQEKLEKYEGRELTLRAIEVNRNRRRLIFSEREARQQMREENRERLLDELVEGEVRTGTVRQLCNFGAFVDLGGADGLIHISELAWRTVRHPGEIVQEGDEIEVYILGLDHDRKRISLSLKRLQPNPWGLVYKTYTAGQLVAGRVTNIVDFGAFVALDVGVEGLLHISEIADPAPQSPGEVVESDQELVLRILSIDAFRRRLSLSLKSVTDEEREEWLAQRAEEQAAATESESQPEPAPEARSDSDLDDQPEAIEEETKATLAS